MGTRKPTIDGLDDVDDEDGVVEEECSSETDLKLHPTDERHAGLGHTPPGVDPYVEESERKKRKGNQGDREREEG